MKRILVLAVLCQAIAFGEDINTETRKIAIKGGIASASVAWLGPITSATLKFALGGEYWFNDHVALGADLGMGGEGYGKVIGTTSHSIVNLKTGGFILDPGITGSVN